jgi:hypothetical protein
VRFSLVDTSGVGVFWLLSRALLNSRYFVALTVRVIREILLIFVNVFALISFSWKCVFQLFLHYCVWLLQAFEGIFGII